MPTAKLTSRQTAVLAAVERLGRPIMADLWEQFPDLQPSTIRRVLDSLEGKGLIAHAGDPSQVYMNGVHWWSTALNPGEPDPRLTAIADAVGSRGLGVRSSIDPHSGHVNVLFPLVELESFLQGLPSAPLEGLRSVCGELDGAGSPCRLEIGTSITADPEPRLAVRLIPAGRR